MTTEDRRLLIIDDDEMLRDLLLEQLSEVGVEIITCPDADEAFGMLRNEKFHAVLCDIMLPTKTGLELLSEIRAEFPDLPFVMLTGYMHEQNMLQAIRLGVTDVLTKPVAAAVLADVVAKAVEIGKKHEDIQLTLKRITKEHPEFKTDLDHIQERKRQISLLRLVNHKNRTPQF